MVDRAPIIHFIVAIVVLASNSVKDCAADAPEIFNGPLMLVEVTQSHMGMPVHLRVYASDESTGREACRVAFDRIAELNNILSDYEPQSELSRFVRTAGRGPQPVSKDLFRVLEASLALAEQSDGLLDPTAAPVIRLWRKARAARELPTPEVVEEALGRVGYRYLRLDREAMTAELMRPEMQLDLGAIAKGYVGDAAVRSLREQGLPRAMFEAGGDMVFGDPPPGEEGWLVRPDNAELPELRLANGAAAISGDTVQFIEIDGQRYGHIIDPRTGQPIRTRQLCLVTAPAGLTADPLATLGTIMPPQKFQAFIEAHDPRARGWVVTLSAPEFPETLEPNP